MIAKVVGSSLVGIDAILVDVEVDISQGLPQFATVGLPDGAVKESKDRVKSALKNSGYEFPSRRITVNLAPADIRKEGTAFDLPISIAILAATGVVKAQRLRDYLLLGELSLDGRVRPVCGCLSVAVTAKKAGFAGVIAPRENAREGAVVEGVDVIGVSELAEVVQFLNGEMEIEPCRVDLREIFRDTSGYDDDFSEVKGQDHAKRAIEVAAAGAHNIIMIGPPGSGKTMLARRIPGILPRMSFDEAIETTKVYSVMGVLERDRALITQRPFRAPHHTISDIGLIGGGNTPRPGEVSLSHNGLLFLDELPEFKKSVLEVLRQPLEDGRVTIARAAVSLSYPADVMLVAAMNPCPCGYLGDRSRPCRCTPQQIRQYQGRISGPLMDRIDIHIEVPSVRYRDLTGRETGESSAAIKARIEQARAIQKNRFAEDKTLFNARMNDRQIRAACPLDEESRQLIEMAVDRLGLSARAYTRILKVARTIADLDGGGPIRSSHVAEAIQYRSLDRRII